MTSRRTLSLILLSLFTACGPQLDDGEPSQNPRRGHGCDLGDHAGVVISSQAEMEDLDDYTTISGNLQIVATDDLEPLSCLEDVSGTLSISGTIGLLDLDGLGALQGVGGSVFFSAASLDGIWSLSSVGDDLGIDGRGVLDSLDDLSGISTVGGGFFLWNYVGTSLDGMEGIDFGGGLLFIEGSSVLTDISALDGMASAGLNLEFTDNASLCQSTIDALVDAWELNGWTGTVTSSGNAGCVAEYLPCDNFQCAVGETCHITQWQSVDMDVCGQTACVVAADCPVPEYGTGATCYGLSCFPGCSVDADCGGGRMCHPIIGACYWL